MNSVLLSVIIALSTGCSVAHKKIKQPENLQITSVKLIGVKAGYRAQAIVVLKDSKRGVIFEETITCSDWSIEDKLHKYVGWDFNVYETVDIKPEYYGLGDVFCIGIYE